jgi:ABC-type spermidine/putrescine transport system permease subunit II
MLSLIPWKIITNVLAGLTAFYFLLPLCVVVPVSFIGEPYLHFPPDTYSLRWYEDVFSDPTWRSAFLNSIKTGIVAVTVAFVIGVPLAFALVRSKFRTQLKGLTIGILILPVIIPIIVFSVGIYVWYLKLRIVHSLLALGFAHALLGLPFMTLVITAALRDLDVRVERAARSLGAKAFTTLRIITFPLLKSALLSGALLTFLQSFDELLIARAVTNFETITLPVKLWNGAIEEISPALAVISSLSIAIALIIASAVFANILRRWAASIGASR